MIHYINFKNRKPSKSMTMRAIGLCLEQGGVKAINITWGESWIDIEYAPQSEQWFGSGWIKDISGDGIALELNQIRKQAIRELADKFQRDHFQFIHIK